MAANLRKVLEAELGSSRAGKFDDEDVSLLVAAKFKDAEDLRNAANQGQLEQLNLPRARLSNLLDHFKGAGAAGGGAGATGQQAVLSIDPNTVQALAVAIKDAMADSKPAKDQTDVLSSFAEKFLAPHKKLL